MRLGATAPDCSGPTRGTWSRSAAVAASVIEVRAPRGPKEVLWKPVGVPSPQNPSRWDGDIARDPDGDLYHIEVRRLGVVESEWPFWFGKLVVTPVSWLWHYGRHWGGWCVEV